MVVSSKLRFPSPPPLALLEGQPRLFLYQTQGVPDVLVASRSRRVRRYLACTDFIIVETFRPVNSHGLAGELAGPADSRYEVYASA